MKIKKTLTIALIGYAHPFGRGAFYGAERLIYYLAQELKRRKHKCVIFSVIGCNLPGFDYISLPKPWDDSVDIYYEAVKKYEQENNIKFDIVHSFQSSGFLDERFRNEYTYCLEPFPLFGLNNFRENIIAYSNKFNEVNGGGFTTIYPGIPKKDYIGISINHDDYLVWIGRIDPGKCPSNAIEVAKRAGKKIILMGPSYNYPYFVDKIWPHIDNEKVVWLRAVDDKTKSRVFKKALAFINPIWDNYHEMFGITNIESLAMGVPVIGWNNSDIQSAIGFQGGEIIEHGKQGFIINHSGYSEEERENAIQSSVESLKNIKTIDRNECIKLFLEKFTSKIMTEKTLKYYSIIQQRGKVLNVSNEL